jgi:hypothetical protein
MGGRLAIASVMVFYLLTVRFSKFTHLMNSSRQKFKRKSMKTLRVLSSIGHRTFQEYFTDCYLKQASPELVAHKQ